MDQKELEALQVFNDTDVPYPHNKTLVDLFEEQLDQHPEKVAVIFKKTSYTYRFLNNYSNQLARYLKTNYSILKEDAIGIQLERSEWMIIAILGVLKAGAAYVPIDPAIPQERTDYIISNSECKLLIDSVALEEIKQELQSFETTNPPKAAGPKNLAYIIYTSGSTGKPKGVMIEHQGIINRIQWMWKQFNYTSNDVILQKTTYTFDVSVWELFMPLCWGTKMVLCEKDDISSPQRILSLIKEHKVTCLHFVPSMLNVFISTLFGELSIKDNLSSLRCVITSGEALPVKTVQNWYAKVDIPIHNLYGPTEATVDVTYYLTQKNDSIIPIGKPIWNTQIYIIDEQNQRVAIGEMGEIIIGGDGVARGYINKPELTAERFVPDPFRKGGFVYKTGDYGRWLSDGNIEYLGRKDDQVKIRGFRIELSEIEKVINEHQGVNESVVVCNERGDDKRLVAYYVPAWTYIKQKEKELYSRQVANWQELFEVEYQKTDDLTEMDPEFNYIGWINSFTGKLLPEEHMWEWLAAISSLIKKENPSHVLEIGCGTGMIFFQLAGTLGKYIGTDLSKIGIKQIEKQIAKGLKNYGPVTFKTCAAHEVALPYDEKVDTIIMNSIIQYFSGDAYLTTVIENCISLLKEGGRIIIGDVRDNRLLKAFKARLHLQNVQPGLSIKSFQEEVDQLVLKEEEICFSPDYFYSLQQRFPQITFIDIQAKQGDHINEMNLYRYNVVIHVGIFKERVKLQWQSWTDIDDKQALINHLNKDSRSFALKDVPNFRLWKERAMLQAISTDTETTVEELVRYINEEDEDTKNVTAFLKAARYNGFECMFYMHNDPLKMNIVIARSNEVDSFIEPLYNVDSDTISFTNIPLFNDINALLQKELKAHLKKSLPEYMVPGYFMALRSIPLSPNGKALRKALPEINLTKQNNRDYIAPRNKTERLIAGIWGDLLRISDVSVFDAFFEIGGNSLLAVQVMSRLEKELGAKLPLALLFQYPTVQKLADFLLNQHHLISWNSLVAIKSSGKKVPLYFVHGAHGDVLFIKALTNSLHPEQPLYALRPLGISGSGKTLNNIEDMASHYISEILEHNPHGPYAFGGYSFGGYVAFEIARQLKKMNKEVVMVALFDSDALMTDYSGDTLKKWLQRISFPILNVAYNLKLLTNNFHNQFTFQKENLKRWLTLRKRNLLGPKTDYCYYRLLMAQICYKARDNYQLKPLDIEIELFRAQQRTYFMFDPKLLGWKKFALKGVRVHDVPGAHHSLFIPPNDEQLGHVLQYCLDKATHKYGHITEVSANSKKDINSKMLCIPVGDK